MLAKDKTYLGGGNHHNLLEIIKCHFVGTRCSPLTARGKESPEFRYSRKRLRKQFVCVFFGHRPLASGHRHNKNRHNHKKSKSSKTKILIVLNHLDLFKRHKSLTAFFNNNLIYLCEYEIHKNNLNVHMHI